MTLAYLWLPYVILPIYAGLERVPDSLLEASGDLGGKSWRTFFSVVLPMLWPSIIAGSIFSFSLSLGDYITVNIVGGANQLLGNLVYTNVGAANNLPLAAAIALIPVAIMSVFLARRAPHGSSEQPMRLIAARPARSRSAGSPAVILAIIYLPLLVVFVNSFSTSKSLPLAAARLHPRVVGAGVHERRVRWRRSPRACSSRHSQHGLALVLGTLVSLALQRYKFFGRDCGVACS